MLKTPLRGGLIKGHYPEAPMLLRFDYDLFLLRSYNILLKQELHSKLGVEGTFRVLAIWTRKA